LYAEKLGLEVGFYPSPYDLLGHYGDELLRAARLVIDPALHMSEHRWTRQQGIEFMRANTTLDEHDVVSEVERYCVLPAQACSYMIGQLKLLELRERVLATPGLSIVDFHRVVLLAGAVPLTTLERAIERLIQQA